jgi:putative acetyltransferase
VSPLVRPELPSDRNAVRALHEAAFGRPVEADLVDRLRGSPGWVPELSLVAEEAGDVVGHVLFTRAAVGGEAALALGPLAVLPACQRRGIGTALVEAGLAATGDALVFLLGDPAYYGRFGFRLAAELGIETPPGYSAAHFQARAGGPTHPRGAARYDEAFAGV